jgi:small subunit ribosomal protein S20
VANIKSQLKRIKTNEKARQRNKAVKSSLKTSIRRFRSVADSGDTAATAEALKVASRELDKAANKKSAMAKRAASL